MPLVVVFNAERVILSRVQCLVIVLKSRPIPMPVAKLATLCKEAEGDL